MAQTGEAVGKKKDPTTFSAKGPKGKPFEKTRDSASGE